jgi:acyl-CoA oxidase
VNGTGLRSLAQNVSDLGSTARSVGRLRDEATQRDLLTGRVEAMVAEVAGKLRPGAKASKVQAAHLFNENQVAVIEMARSHAELLQWEAFTEALAGITDDDTKTVLTWLRDLFGLGLIEKHLAWYLINGRLSAKRASSVAPYIDRLVARLRKHAQDLVDSFGYGPEHIRASIATGAEAVRQTEARQYYAAQAAAGRTPATEKSPQRR